ncbi:unnamed protein product [Trichobilharzia regenti]|nr:unnamed protein product [Trichobilharzia regenti]
MSDYKNNNNNSTTASTIHDTSLYQDIFTYFRYQATKNEMLTTRKDTQGNWKPAWRETDLDRCNGQELNADNHNINHGDIIERNQRKLMHNNIDGMPSVDEIHEKHEISR